MGLAPAAEKNQNFNILRTVEDACPYNLQINNAIHTIKIKHHSEKNG